MIVLEGFHMRYGARSVVQCIQMTPTQGERVMQRSGLRCDRRHRRYRSMAPPIFDAVHGDHRCTRWRRDMVRAMIKRPAVTQYRLWFCRRCLMAAPSELEPPAAASAPRTTAAASRPGSGAVAAEGQVQLRVRAP
jgi:hypothetical protein